VTAPAVNADGEITDPLTDAEYARLETLETTISKGMDTFVEVGSALAEIRDSRLYRQYHRSFDAYCRDQWDLGKSQAYRLITASEVVGDLSRARDESDEDVPLPTSGRQAEELAKADPADRVDVMREAAEDGPVTSSRIKEAVTRRTETPAKGREVRTETIETEPVAKPERDARGKRAAEQAHQLACSLTAYVPHMVDERTVARLEAWCRRWRETQ
jgi:hypothetical protein